MNIQEIFNSQKNKITIPSGEYEGPLVINKKCEIIGNNATIWTKNSPAIIVETGDVVIKNLRAEFSQNNGENTIVILKNSDVKFENFEVFGEVEFPNKNISKNDIPRIINLEEFKANTENVFMRKIILNNDYIVENNISGLSVFPQKLSAGENHIELKISPLKSDTIIYGSFILKAKNGIVRRIYVSGISKENAAKFDEKISSKNNAKNNNKNQNINDNTNHSDVKQITKGERIILNENAKNFMVFSAKINSDKIDPYIFLLYENGKTKSDDDIIFFGNPKTQGVCLEEKNGITGINFDLKNIPHEIKKIAATFAVYEEDGNKNLNFYSIKNPEILFYENDKLKFNFPLDLTLEKAINAVEFYRRNGIWKANFVGAGFNNGIREICKMFGIDVK